MSYSFDEFFENEIFPKLKDLVNGKVSGDMDDSDKFLAILSGAFGTGHLKESFVYQMVQAVVNPHQEDLSTEKLLQMLFSILREDMELRKIEYTDGNSIIKVNYNGITEEQDLLDKIAEKVRDLK